MLIENILIFGSIIAALMAPSIMIGLLMQTVAKALARNPASVSNIFMWMIGVLGLVEVSSIVTILIIFRLFSTH